ncbi:hypothetical protein PVAP13_5NG362400 [Panicum virgatum]|uniref:Uncharacterized protein n=1 Tax=Panicum virgatum TaxID=38727 RepID=A0A8T0RSW1_PANVG|nr:hypothetical protein PVAP13_5NG362400 [Panicum virgatum]
MARAHPATSSSSERTPPVVAASASSSSPALLLHAAWVAAAVAVCVALCTIHARKPSSSSSRRRGSRSASSRRGSSRESGVAGAGAAGGATPAKVSPTPSDTAAKANGAAGVETAADGGPVTVIDVGTHGPIAPAFLPPPDPLPPRRSLSLSLSGKHMHIRFAERFGRIRSMRRGGSGEDAAPAAAEDDVFVVGCRRGGGEVGEEGTLWTKTIILGERCRVPSAGNEDGGAGDVAVPWKSYRTRQPRSVPVTRSNSFAGVGSAGARRLGDPRF